MSSGKTVILGEASESEGEEVATEVHVRTHQTRTTNKKDKNITNDLKSTLTGSSLFATINNLILQASSVATAGVSTTSTAPDRPSLETKRESPLERSLISKNQQFLACLDHLYRHPYEKASKDLYGLSQRLVNVQKTIQVANATVRRVKIDLDLIP